MKKRHFEFLDWCAIGVLVLIVAVCIRLALCGSSPKPDAEQKREQYNGECAKDAPCDDGNVCTVGDECVNGVCTGETVCDDNEPEPCTVDPCDPLLIDRDDPDCANPPPPP